MITPISKDSASKSQKVEKIGIFFEKLNIPPVASRVFAYLLITEPPHASFEEIREFLGTSKSSISNAIKFLIQDNRIDYITFNRDRKRYFKANPSLWKKSMIDKVSNWKNSIEFLKDILQERREEEEKESSKFFNRSLEESIQFEAYIQQKMIQAIKDWDKMMQAAEVGHAYSASIKSIANT